MESAFSETQRAAEPLQQFGGFIFPFIPPFDFISAIRHNPSYPAALLDQHSVLCHSWYAQRCFSMFRLVLTSQIDCLICLPDKSGNFLVFGPEIARNTLKQAKTGFGMAITARLRSVFCVFRPKIPRTFYFKLTEQSSRKKVAEGGFEPKNDMMQ